MQCHRQHQDQRRRSGEVGPEFMFQLMVLLLSVIVGIHYGDRFGSDYGILVRIVGWLLGPVIVTLLAFGTWLLLYLVIVDPIERILTWWRPHPPPCENKTCTHAAGYRAYKLPDDVARRWKGLASWGRQCGCGRVYAGGNDSPLRDRWVRVLPDGSLRPYLRHRLFGRWKPDRADAVIAVPATYKETPPAEINFPTGTPTIVLTLFTMATSLWVVWSDLPTHELAYPFVAACTLLALITGIVVEWRMLRSQRESEAARDNDPVQS